MTELVVIALFVYCLVLSHRIKKLRKTIVMHCFEVNENLDQLEELLRVNAE